MTYDLFYMVMWYVVMSFTVWLPVSLVVDVVLHVRYNVQGDLPVTSTITMVWVLVLLSACILGFFMDLFHMLHV